MTRRIELNRFGKEKVETVGGGCVTGSLREVMNVSLELKEVINLLKEKVTQQWVSDGNWSMHQLLLAILDITGPAVVHLSTYALSETPTRHLVQMKDKGLIKDLYCIIDNRVDTRTAATLQIIKSISTDFALVDTHAKVTVVTNDDWTITVNGSANYTQNKRYESGSIFCTPEAANMQLRWIKKALKDGIKH